MFQGRRYKIRNRSLYTFYYSKNIPQVASWCNLQVSATAAFDYQRPRHERKLVGQLFHYSHNMTLKQWEKLKYFKRKLRYHFDCLIWNIFWVLMNKHENVFRMSFLLCLLYLIVFTYHQSYYPLMIILGPWW